MAPLMYITIIRVRARQVWFVSDYTSVTMALGGSMVIKAILKVAMNLIYM